MYISRYCRLMISKDGKHISLSKEHFLVQDIDWSSKLVISPDSSLEAFNPIVQLKFHGPNSETLVFEFTIGEMYAKFPPGYLTRSGAKIIIGGTSFFMFYETITGNEKFHRKILMPLVHRYVDAETAHKFGVRLAKSGFLEYFSNNQKEYPELETEVFGTTFNNPIGIAAGFDKNGEAIGGLRKSGLGFVEIGSITPLPQEGNPKPRVFRLLEDKGVINRYGFNSAGVGSVSELVQKAYFPDSLVPFGVNLGKNKDTVKAELDYEIGATYFGPFCDYLVVNVSSPNTPGLRSLQNKDHLIKILVTVRDSINRIDPTKPKPKLLVKISPDLSETELKDIAKITLDRKYGIDGIIVSNTTISRPENLKSDHKNEIGGLSGEPLKELSTKNIRQMYNLTGGKVPIIGCGGVFTGSDAYEKIRAGASLIQLYTGIVYEGFPIIGKVKRELVECLQKDGFSNVADAVGADHRSKK